MAKSEGNFLTLENALLFTDGDLVVTGKVTGTGAIVSKGGVTISQTSTLTANNQLAIVADKDVTIAGQGSFLQGMIYTHGNFYGENFTLVGNLIAQSSDENKGQAVLQNVTLISNQQSADLTVTTPVYSGDAGGNLWHNGIIEAQYPGHPITEQFDIQASSITDLAGLKTALETAANNFNATTAAALDQYAAINFHIICNADGNVQDHTLFSSMVALNDKLQQLGAAGYIASVNATGTTIPANLDLPQVIKGLLTNIKHKLDTQGVGNGTVSGCTMVTDLRLNKYVTRVLPTRITFQGELP